MSYDPTSAAAGSASEREAPETPLANPNVVGEADAVEDPVPVGEGVTGASATSRRIKWGESTSGKGSNGTCRKGRDRGLV